MGLKLNTIITLENQEKYILLNETLYGGVKYFLVMGLDANKDIIPSKVKIIEEVIKDNELFVKTVKDPELIIILTRILKAQL